MKLATALLMLILAAPALAGDTTRPAHSPIMDAIKASAAKLQVISDQQDQNVQLATKSVKEWDAQWVKAMADQKVIYEAKVTAAQKATASEAAKYEKLVKKPVGQGGTVSADAPPRSDRLRDIHRRFVRRRDFLRLGTGYQRDVRRQHVPGASAAGRRVHPAVPQAAGHRGDRTDACCVIAGHCYSTRLNASNVVPSQAAVFCCDAVSPRLPGGAAGSLDPVGHA